MQALCKLQIWKLLILLQPLNKASTQVAGVGSVALTSSRMVPGLLAVRSIRRV